MFSCVCVFVFLSAFRHGRSALACCVRVSESECVYVYVCVCLYLCESVGERNKVCVSQDRTYKKKNLFLHGVSQSRYVQT